MSNLDIRNVIFQHLPDLTWTNLIWFKGHAINLSIFCWMAYIEGLKTLDKFYSRGLGNTFLCFICSSAYESHKHLFFECSFYLEHDKSPAT